MAHTNLSTDQTSTFRPTRRTISPSLTFGTGPTPPLTKSIKTAKSKLDSMSEIGETESLRLQMAMDRVSKLMSTLSNLLKKASEIDSGIIQNIK